MGAEGGFEKKKVYELYRKGHGTGESVGGEGGGLTDENAREKPQRNVKVLGTEYTKKTLTHYGNPIETKGNEGVTSKKKHQETTGLLKMVVDFV